MSWLVIYRMEYCGKWSLNQMDLSILLWNRSPNDSNEMKKMKRNENTFNEFCPEISLNKSHRNCCQWSNGWSWTDFGATFDSHFVHRAMTKHRNSNKRNSVRVRKEIKTTNSEYIWKLLIENCNSSFEFESSTILLLTLALRPACLWEWRDQWPHRKRKNSQQTLSGFFDGRTHNMHQDTHLNRFQSTPGHRCKKGRNTDRLYVAEYRFSDLICFAIVQIGLRQYERNVLASVIPNPWAG